VSDGPTALGGSTEATSLPEAVDRATFQAQLDELRARDKAHTREGDAIAAARRRLPMVEVDANLTLVGPDGPMTLLDAFEGRRQLNAHYFMWHAGHRAAEQCEGCTWVTSHVAELSGRRAFADNVVRGFRVPLGFPASRTRAIRNGLVRSVVRGSSCRWHDGQSPHEE